MKVIYFSKKMRTGSLIILLVRKCLCLSIPRGKPSISFLLNLRYVVYVVVVVVVVYVVYVVATGSNPNWLDVAQTPQTWNTLDKNICPPLLSWALRPPKTHPISWVLRVCVRVRSDGCPRPCPCPFE